MDDLRTLLDQLEDKRLDYVLARSKVNSDRQAYISAGINKTTFYHNWSPEERERLNDLAQRVKRETATRALIVLQDAAEEAAHVQVAGLKDRDARIRLASSDSILDRVLGKPSQPTDVSGTIEVNVNDAREAIQRKLAGFTTDNDAE